MTVAGGIALAVSLVLMLADIEVILDPAWITIVICGIPLLYLAVTRLIFQRWVSPGVAYVYCNVACIYT